MFRPHVGNKPRLKLRGNTDGTSRVPRFQSLSTQSMAAVLLELNKAMLELQLIVLVMRSRVQLIVSSI